MTQYQCVVPRAVGPEAVEGLLELLARRRACVCLCVIKNCGDEGDGTLSFPLRGTSLAVDLPVDDWHAGPGRRAQRTGDRAGRADLPRQGRVHPPGALPRDGAAPGALDGGAPPVGSGRCGCAARNRCASWGIRHERGPPRRHPGHGPGGGPAARGAGRRRLPARPERGGARPLGARPAGAGRVAGAAGHRGMRPRPSRDLRVRPRPGGDRPRRSRRGHRDRGRASPRRKRSKPTPSGRARWRRSTSPTRSASASTRAAGCWPRAGARSACSRRWRATAGGRRW